jgi:hypothetical protein
MKTDVYTKAYTQIFIALLFTAANIWKQTRCSSIAEHMNTLKYIQTMEYYAAKTRNEITRYEKTLRKEDIL